MESKGKVLLTGVTGFLGSHTAIQLLENNYEVVGTLRIKEVYPKRKIPTSTLPNFMVRLISNFDKTLQPILIDLGVVRKVDNTKAKKLLQWIPLSNREAVISCAQSVIDLKLV